MHKNDSNAHYYIITVQYSTVQYSTIQYNTGTYFLFILAFALCVQIQKVVQVPVPVWYST